MLTYRKGITTPLSRLLGVLSWVAALFLALPSAALAAGSLHFTGAKRVHGEHVYTFTGYYNYQGTSQAERVTVSVKGTYYPASVMAEEVQTFKGSHGTVSLFTKWDCAKDPWLNRNVSCTQPRPSLATNMANHAAMGYAYDYCRHASPDRWCFASRNLVPSGVAPLVRNGPPAPTVAGPSQALAAKKPMLTLKYASGVANRFWIQQWVCPEGKDGPPTNTPIDMSPFGGACTSTVKGPLGLKPNGSTRPFRLSYPNAVPKAGYWYVRARLGSDRYGKGVWGHWHRTFAKAPMHFQDTFNPPLILAPSEGQRFIQQQIKLRLKPRVKIGDCSHDVWYYDAQWQRAKIVEPTNEPTRGAIISKARLPWKGYDKYYRIGACNLTGPFSLTYQYNDLRSHDLHYGYRYWVHIRLHNLTTGRTSNWSPWRSFVVQEPIYVPKPPLIPKAPASGGSKTLRRAQPKTLHPLKLPPQH